MNANIRTLQVAGILCVAGLVGLATAARADVTVTQKSTGKTTGETTIRIKGNKMRIDMTNADRATAMLMDLDAQQMTMLDTKKKEAVVMPVAQIQEAMNKTTGTMTVKTKLTPTGEKKQVAGYNCAVYDVGIAVPFMAGQGGEGGMLLAMNGPACLAKDVPGQADFVRLYKASVEKGFIFSDPRAAAGPGASMAKGMAELNKAIAEAGIPVEQTTNVSLEGSGPMVGMMNKMIKSTTTMTVQSIVEGPLAEDLFTVPADYKLKKP